MSDDLAIRRWVRNAAKSSGPKIEQSRLFLSLLTNGYEKEPLAALQFGIAVLLDKPIFVLAPHGTKIPENIRRMAKAIEFCDMANKNDTEQATLRLLKGHVDTTD